MKPKNQIALWELDRWLVGLDRRIGSRPQKGWVRTLREALGLTYVELGQRAQVSGARIFQIERAEVNGLVQLGTLERVASALNCQFLYVFVPNQPLESMDVMKNPPRYSTE